MAGCDPPPPGVSEGTVTVVGVAGGSVTAGGRVLPPPATWRVLPSDPPPSGPAGWTDKRYCPRQGYLRLAANTNFFVLLVQ